MENVTVWTSETGKSGTGTFREVEFFHPEAEPMIIEFCFVCCRSTNHIGEHDDLVEQGLASYEVTADGFESYVNRTFPR